MAHLLFFTPDTGIVVLTVSVILIFVELNRPGMILPGSLGLTGFLLFVNSARQWQFDPSAVLLLFAVALLCLWQVRHASPYWSAYLNALACAVAFAFLLKAKATAPVHKPIAALCGCLIGASSSVLARVAHRARENKGLD